MAKKLSLRARNRCRLEEQLITRKLANTAIYAGTAGGKESPPTVAAINKYKLAVKNRDMMQDRFAVDGRAISRRRNRVYIYTRCALIKLCL